MDKKYIILIVAVVVLAGVGLAWWRAMPERSERYSGPIEEITFAPQQSETQALIWIAEQNGYFADNKLNVTIAKPATGREVMNAIQMGSADVGGLGGWGFSMGDIEKNNLKILSAIDARNTVQLLARTESGIAHIADLKGKRIGVAQKTEMDFSLYRFLEKNNLAESDVHMIDVPSEAIVDAIVSGKVDAVMTGEPYVDQIQKSLGNKVIAWNGQSGQPYYSVLISKQDFIASHKLAIEKFLSALVRAEVFMKMNASVAEEIISARLTYEPAWQKHNFSVLMTEEMLSLMDDEARWMILKKFTDKTEIPKYRDHLYLDAIKKVKPEGVTIME